MSNIIFYNGQDIMSEYDTYYAEGYRAIGQLYPVMARDQRIYLGDQWTLDEVNALKEEGRHYYTINKTKPKVDWINGYQIQNRLSSVALPINDGHQKTADQYTKALLNVMTQRDGYKYISETFGSGNSTGWSLLNTYLDYTLDPIDGDISFGRDPYSAIMMDPYFTRLDWSDCNWVIKRKYLSPTQCINLLPGQEDEVMQLARDGWERDNKFTWMVFQRIPTGQRMMAYNEFWRQKYYDQKVLVNRTTNQWSDFDGDKDTLQLMQQLAAQQGHNLEVITRKKRYVEKHIVVNNTYLRTEVNPYGLDEYPFAIYIPIFAPESEEYTFKIQSLVRQIIDPQRELNRRRSQIVDIVESQLNSGWIEEDGAVKNPKMLYQSGQGKRIVLNPDYKIDSIQRIPAVSVPGSMFQETQQAENDLMEILGLNPTTFGQVETKQVSALVEMQRQAASLTGQQYLFENLREMQKYISRKVLKIIQGWSPTKVKQIIGEEPTEDFYDPFLMRYDIAVAEGINTDTQKYMMFRQALELKQLGEPIPPGELTKLSLLQGKAEFLQDVQEYQKKISEQEQQVAQSTQQQEQAMAQSLQARAISDLALSKERQARAISNLGLEDERISRSVKDREDAVLNHFKGIAEILKLESETKISKDGHLMNVLNAMQQYENHLQQRELAEKAQNISISQAQGQQSQNAQQSPQNQPTGG